MAGDATLGEPVAVTPSPSVARAAMQRPALPPPVRGAAGRSTKGLALWLSICGMATLTFNATRVAGWTLSDLFFLGSASVILASLLTGNERWLAPKRFRRGSQLVLAGALLMLTFGTISAFGSWSPLASMMVIVRMGWSTLVWFWIMRSVCRDRDALHSLIYAYQVSVMISAVVGVLGENGVAFSSGDFGDRQPGFTYHPGELMNFLVTGFFFFLVPLVIPKSGVWPERATLAWAGAVVVIVLGIFATGSTSALVALGVAVVVVAVVATMAGSAPSRHRRSPIATMVLVAAAVVGMIVLATSDEPIIERLSGYADGSSGLDDSLESREVANAAIIEELDRYLIVGIGPFFAGGAADSVAMSQYGAGGAIHNGVHNMQLKMVYEFGLIALVGLWVIIIATLRQAYKLVISTKGTALYPVALAMLGSVVAAVTSSQFGPTSYARHFWLPFALVSCLWAVRRQELAHPPEGNDPSTLTPAVSGG
jgi:hypothetical protein